MTICERIQIFFIQEKILKIIIGCKTTCSKKCFQAFKKVVHKTAKATSELVENKIADAVTNSNGDKVVRQEPVEEERDEILIIIKMEHYKILKLLNDSTVSKFMPKKKQAVVNGVSSGQYSVNKNIRFRALMLNQIYVTIVMHALL